MPLLHTGQFFGQGSGGGVGGHRYWRLLIDMNSDGGSGLSIDIAECELRESIGGADVTGGGTASADTVFSGRVASNAFDNNNANIWSATNSAFPHWLKYDFGVGNPKNIVEVAITCSTSPTVAPRDWSLQYSDDDSAWTTLWSVYGEAGWTSNEQRVYSDPGAPALYVYPGITDAHDILGSAMRGWYAADRITGSNGDAQARWHDISGQGYFLRQQNSSLRPTLVTADLNGLNTLRFTSADSEVMQLPSPVLTGATSASAYLVVKVNADPAAALGSSGLWRIGSDGSNNDHFPLTDSNIYSGFASTARKSAGNPTPSLASWRIVGFHSAASDFGIYIDGVSFFSTATNTVGIFARPQIGRSIGTPYLNGWIAEVIFTDAKQSSGDREKIEGYLAHKWGLTGNLDAGHPYKSSPP